MLLGHINSNLSILNREAITPELNCSYHQTTFKLGSHLKYLFGDDLPKAVKKISETNKFALISLRTKNYPYSGQNFPFQNPYGQQNHFLLTGHSYLRGRFHHPTQKPYPQKD